MRSTTGTKVALTRIGLGLLAACWLVAAGCADTATEASDASDAGPTFGPGADATSDATGDAGGGDASGPGDTGVGGSDGGDALPDDTGPGAGDTATGDVAVTPTDVDGGGGDAPIPGADPTIAPLPLVSLKQGYSTTLDLAPYIADDDDADEALALSWSAKHVAIADTGSHVLLLVAPGDWTGVEQIPVTVTDPAGHEATEVLNVEVLGGDVPVEPPPPDPEECGEVAVSLVAPEASQVLIAGSFNQWAATPENAIQLFDTDGDGTWTTTLTLDPGTYPYKFIVDGTWIADPANPNTVDDGYGGTNSVLVVEPCGEDPPPPPECGLVTFSLEAPGASEVLVSGEFNGWGGDASSAWPLADPDGDGTWTRDEKLDPGSYQYKFVVDGSWIPDPANPDSVDDGFGGKNSLLTLADCAAGGALLLKAHDTTGSTFTATFASADGGAIDAAQVDVTVDWDAASGALAADGGSATLTLDGLATGIHDVRVTAGGATLLLKVYVGTSTDWRDTLLYFAMTDRFANGDAGNDAPIPEVDGRVNYQGGDFAGITQKIEAGYFDDLGVSALWVSWPVDNPDFYEEGAFPDQDGCGLDPKSTKYTSMRYTGYHGYWPANLDQVESRFGTLDELQGMVVAAHDRGIRVLLDFTANHVHDSSPFYQAHKDEGYFNFPAEICQDVGWDTKPKTCWFVDYLPDLNYTNPAARKAILDSAVSWVKKTGADGFRFDAVKHLEMAFVEELRARAKAELELTGVDFYIVGETFTGDAGLIQSFVGPYRIHGQFDFPSNLHLLKGFAKGEEGLDQMDQQIRAIKGVYADPGLMSTFIGNHDIARFTSHAAGMISCGVWDVVSNVAQGWRNPPGQPTSEEPYQKLRLALTYALTVPGIPLIYYGDELGMPGAGDPDNRRFMRFGGELSGNESATLAFVQKLGKARAAHPSLRTGAWSAPLWADGDFLAYARTGGGETAVVLLNRGSGTKSGTLQVGGLGVTDGATLTDALGGGTQTVSGGGMPFSIGARSAAIFVTGS